MVRPPGEDNTNSSEPVDSTEAGEEAAAAASPHCSSTTSPVSGPEVLNSKQRGTAGRMKDDEGEDTTAAASKAKKRRTHLDGSSAAEQDDGRKGPTGYTGPGMTRTFDQREVSRSRVSLRNPLRTLHNFELNVGMNRASIPII